jgi:hypothetical protein
MELDFSKPCGWCYIRIDTDFGGHLIHFIQERYACRRLCPRLR